MSTLGPYGQSVPGCVLRGNFASLLIIPWRSDSLSRALAYPAFTSKPAVWLISWRMVIGRGLRHLTIRRRHLEAGEFRDVFGDRIIERPLALLPEHHHRHAHDGLGHRREAKDSCL